MVRTAPGGNRSRYSTFNAETLSILATGARLNPSLKHFVAFAGHFLISRSSSSAMRYRVEAATKKATGTLDSRP
jgi:hypothetical protein